MKAVLDTIVQENLLARVTEVGQELQTGLADLSTKHPGLLANVRGRGTFCAVDCDSAERRERIVSECNAVRMALQVMSYIFLYFWSNKQFTFGPLLANTL